MRTLVLIHRWLGVAFCLLFAMWFATGVVMHFVPYPSLTEAERIAGLAPLGAGSLPYGPDAAVAATGIREATRVRLLSRADGAVYVVESGSNCAQSMRAIYRLPLCARKSSRLRSRHNARDAAESIRASLLSAS